MNFSYLSCVFENNKRRIKLFLESVVKYIILAVSCKKIKENRITNRTIA